MVQHVMIFLFLNAMILNISKSRIFSSTAKLSLPKNRPINQKLKSISISLAILVTHLIKHLHNIENQLLHHSLVTNNKNESVSLKNYNLTNNYIYA